MIADQRSAAATDRWPVLEEPLRVLAVDDDPVALAALEAMALNAGFDFRPVEDARRVALEVAAFEPDVILVDLFLPGTTGLHLCASLKDAEDTQFIPVVLLTAHDGPRERLQGMQAGCDDFMIKPFNRAELVARVRSLGRMRRAVLNLDRAEHVLAVLARAVEAKDGTTGTTAGGFPGRARHSASTWDWAARS